jgi:hypothetical protein
LQLTVTGEIIFRKSAVPERYSENAGLVWYRANTLEIRVPKRLYLNRSVPHLKDNLTLD